MNNIFPRQVLFLLICLVGSYANADQHCFQEHELFLNLGSGSFQISENCDSLTIIASDSEQGYWIPGLLFSKGQQISFDVSFTDQTDAVVGRHGGIVLGERSLDSTRWTTNGLVFDYIDRDDPTGYRVYNQGLATQHYPVSDYTPAVRWTILMPISGPNIFVLDQVYIGQSDYNVPYGFIGFWVWNGKVTISHLVIQDI